MRAIAAGGRKGRRRAADRPRGVRRRREPALDDRGRQLSRRLQRLLASDRPPLRPGPQDPVEAAAEARLAYVSDDGPGITRIATRQGFRYVRPGGRLVRDRATVERISRLAVPPAWTAVWICPRADGHIQATGRDARGRKQYRYHPRWREIRDRTKFGHLVDFARALPRIRRVVAADLRRPGLPARKVLATVVRLLETTAIRVGSDEYARANHHFGLTTLHNRHVAVRGPELRFHFQGKSGKEHVVGVRDRRLARIVRNCQEIPGQRLFQYCDERGRRHAVGSGDVNDYLRAVSGSDFTAKDFRTWVGTTLVAARLAGCPEATSAAAAKRNVLGAIDAAAELLGNTRAVCRASYVHPAVVDAYTEGRMRPLPRARRSSVGLDALERATLRLLAAAARRTLPRWAAASKLASARRET
jgi:DNA topoisomerase I